MAANFQDQRCLGVARLVTLLAGKIHGKMLQAFQMMSLKSSKCQLVRPMHKFSCGCNTRSCGLQSCFDDVVPTSCCTRWFVSLLAKLNESQLLARTPDSRLQLHYKKSRLPSNQGYIIKKSRLPSNPQKSRRQWGPLEP